MRRMVLAALAAWSCATPASMPATATVPPARPTPTGRGTPVFMSDPNYPRTRREDVKDVLHGVEVHDPYRWLEDEKSPEVQAWMKAQDDYARARLAKLPGRDAIAARLKELLY